MNALHFHGNIGTGSLAVWMEISESDWFDLNTGTSASENDVNAVFIPPHLRANYREVRFQFDAERHCLFFVTRVGKTNFSVSAISSYASRLLNDPRIKGVYGQVDLTVIPDSEAIDHLLDRHGLREVEIIVNRPNPYSITGDDAEVSSALEELRASRMRLTLDADAEGGLQLNQEIRVLANVAARSGEVKAIVKSEGDPVARPISSLSFPAREDVRLLQDESVDEALTRGREAITRKHLDVGV